MASETAIPTISVRLCLTAARTALLAALRAPGAPFASQLPPTHGEYPLDIRTSQRNRRITIEWVAGPTEHAVRAVAEPVMQARPWALELVLDRHSMWTCGLFHQTEMQAWESHEGSEYLTLEGACHCCGEGGEYEISTATRQRLTSEGYRFQSACRPGNYVKCPDCSGYGQRVLLGKTSNIVPCATCGRRGIFDLDDPDQAATYQTVWDQLVAAAWDKYRAELSKTK